MDLYSTSFTVYPRSDSRPSHSYSPNSSIDFTPNLRTPRDASASSYSLSHPSPSHPAPPRLPHSNEGTPVLASSIDPYFDAVQRVCVEAMTLHGCIVTFNKSDDNKGWNFYLSGGYQQVMATRGMILRECPIERRTTIKVTRAELLESPISSAVKPSVRRNLDEISSQTRATISIVNSVQPHPSSTQSSTGAGTGLGFEAERMCELVITGVGESIDIARVKLLVMLDEMSGLHAESCEIDYKLHSIIASRKRAVVQSIQEETATNIYFPNPLQGLMNPSSQPNAKQTSNTIWITGEFFGVQRARDMLFQVSMHKVRSKAVISRDTAILPRKLDWMLTQRADDLRAIMIDNGTFINFPPVGSQASLISVYGDHRVNIQRTIRSIMQLACQFYVASFWLLPINFNVLMPASTVNPSHIPNVLKRIAMVSGAEVVFKSNCFEMHGLEHEVRSAVLMVLELDVVKSFHHEIRFQLELANEHRDFISGKKNGKINKIMQSTNVKIKFETFNDHNFLIDVASNDQGVIHGLSMLQEELPAEISFHVPETYHKRIIGVGGRSIQRIMKKYGVYVKFNSSEELAAALLDNEDNVVARTPGKNALNLDNLKQAVMELVNPKDKDYILETVSIPRRYHRSLFGEKAIFVHDIEAKTNSKIRFPGDGSDAVTIFGPESQVHIAAAMLLDHVPFEAELTVPPQPDLVRICASSEFLAFTERIKREFEVIIIPLVRQNPGEESTFKFKTQRSNSDFLSTAREMLEGFLLQNNIRVYQTQAHKRVDSFTDAFPHFDSKLLSSATTPAESPELARATEGFAERRLRLANSTPDVKALFNSSPSYVYKLPEHDESDDAGFQTPSTYAPGAPLNDFWNPPRMPIAVGSQHDAFKRGSDSLLEAKIKEHISKPRSLTNRAQSLDLTSLSRSGPINTISETPDRPLSPTESSGNPSPPPSAMIPSFPSVNGPGLLTKARPRPARMDDLDEITRNVAQLNFH